MAMRKLDRALAKSPQLLLALAILLEYDDLRTPSALWREASRANFGWLQAYAATRTDDLSVHVLTLRSIDFFSRGSSDP